MPSERNDTTYIDGFVAAVPQESKRAYLDQAREALSLFKHHGEHGWSRIGVATWRWARSPISTTLYRSETAKPFCSVGSHGGRKTCGNAGMKVLEQDDRMKTLVMPFDGQRMIYGGFATGLDV